VSLARNPSCGRRACTPRPMTDGTLSSYVFRLCFLFLTFLNPHPPVISRLACLFPHFPRSILLINLSIIFSLSLPNPLCLGLANTQQLQLRMRLATRVSQQQRRCLPLSRHRHTTPRVTDVHGYAICFHGDAELHHRL
jgi:hypothetical protein